jgi:hypothetical protein
LKLARLSALLKEAGLPDSTLNKLIRRDVRKALAEDRERRTKPSLN